MSFREIRERAFDYWWIVAIVVTGAWLLALTVYVQGFGKPAGDVPLIGGDTIKITAATGVEGFNVEAFCADPATTVEGKPSPDAAGVTYQLTRTRSGVSETVVVVFGQAHDVLYSKHFWDTPAGQQSEPAFVTSKAQRCIADRAR